MGMRLLKRFSTFTRLEKKVSPNSLKSKTKNVSSKHWLSRQLSDPYVEKAKLMNYRCRSAFKLLEIDEKYKILKPGQIVLDVGASPGSWSQVIAHKINSNGKNKELLTGTVIAIDKQNIYPIEGVTIFGNMDFTSEEMQKKLMEFLGERKVDIVASDMAPSATGIRDMDNENMLKLCYSVLRFSLQVSKNSGIILMKLWQCGDTKKLENDICRFYNNVKVVKPKSSRSDSTEIYLLGREFKGLRS
ncbi:rRNA methyltransferase 2, mitochondrial [Diorhabda carinulata]|uniref:rRNA methyltransferase 2, mitochondrial n=1 Tax=Diorhabda carinulata TaxID=1163345 RepID=UPI0025A04F33|nr:rRNA methyltransferase 2, mitochondrial [Diorhabda carinulata]